MTSARHFSLGILLTATAGCEWALGADFGEVPLRPDAAAAHAPSDGGGGSDARGGLGGGKTGNVAGASAGRIGESGAGAGGGGLGGKKGENVGGASAGRIGESGAGAGGGGQGGNAGESSAGHGGEPGAGGGPGGIGGIAGSDDGGSVGAAGLGGAGGEDSFTCNGYVSPPVTCAQLACDELACDQFLWRGGRIPYEFDAGMRRALRETFAAAVDAWMDASSAVQFTRCPEEGCQAAGETRWLEVRPGVQAEPWVPVGIGREALLLDSESSTPAALVHELGHVIGLVDVWQRPDRDRNVLLSWDYFCSSPSRRASARKCGVWPGATPDRPDRATGQFGPFDSRSKMNRKASFVCEKDDAEPAADSLPTAWDGASVTELYREEQGWSPLRSLGKERSATEPLDETLAEGVNLAGSPTVSSAFHPTLDVWARGDDGRIYTKYAFVSAGELVRFEDWVDLGCCFDSDPAGFSWHVGDGAVFARRTNGELYFAVFPDPASPQEWGPWTSIGRPEAGISSSPAVASWERSRIDVFVRGGDDYLYHKKFDQGWDAEWERLGDRLISGRPSATATGTGSLVVAVNGGDDAVWLLHYTGQWASEFESLGGSMYPGSSPAIGAFGGSDLHVFVRGPESRLHIRELVGSWKPWIELGGVLAGDPAVTTTLSDSQSVHVVAPVSVNGVPAVWWKSNLYIPACTVDEASHGCAACTKDSR